MEIGTVLIIDILGEEKTCVIINKKYYCDFIFEDVITTPFLTRYYDSDDGTNGIVYLKKYTFNGGVMCYELMYGDKRVWVLGESMLATMVKTV